LDIRLATGDYSDFFDFLTKVALNVRHDEEEIEQKDEGEA
jgi:hypothetical protein